MSTRPKSREPSSVEHVQHAEEPAPHRGTVRYSRVDRRPLASFTANSEVTFQQAVEELKRFLIDKQGSLERAFRWLDFSGRKTLSRSQFTTGLRIMNPPPALLATVKRLKIFPEVDKKRGGGINIKHWRAFFDYASEARNNEACDAPGGARPSTSDLWRASSQSPPNSNLQTLPEGDEVKQASDDFGVVVGSDTLPSIAAVRRNSSSGNVCRGSVLLQSEDTEAAEALQLQEDLQAMNLAGIKALAYVLCAKCGSLDKAFKWLDTDSDGLFTQVNLQLAETILHIDFEAVTGLKPQKIYAMMCGNRDCVSKSSWDRFYASSMSDADWAAINEHQATFQKRAKANIKSLWTKQMAVGALKRSVGTARQSVVASSAFMGGRGQKPAARDGKDLPKDSTHPAGAAPAAASATGTVEPSHRATVGEDRSRSKQQSKAAGADHRDEAGGSTAGATMPGNAAALDAPGASGASGGARQAPNSMSDSSYSSSGSSRHTKLHGATGFSSSTAAGNAAVTAGSGGRPGSSGMGPGPKSATPAGDMMSASPDVPTELRRGSSSRAPSKELPLDVFAEKARNEMSGLGKDEGLQYKLSKRTERQKVESIVAQLGFFSAQVGQTFLVFNEGDLAAQIRDRIEGLMLGENLEFEDLTPVQWLFAHAIASSYKALRVLTTTCPAEGEKGTIAFFSAGRDMSEIREGLRSFLLKIESGQIREFLSSCMGPEWIEEAKRLGKDTGLYVQAKQGKLAIGNLSEFKREVRKDLRALPKGESLWFGEDRCWHSLMNQVVQQAAKELKLETSLECSPETGKEHVVVEKPGEDSPDSDGEWDLAHDLDFVRARALEVFMVCATGVQGNYRFLRRPDLNGFLEGLCAYQRRETERVREAVHLIFDDTLELQVDMGTRAIHGITQDYFQVFLTKVSNLLGMSIMAMLRELGKFFVRK